MNLLLTDAKVIFCGDIHGIARHSSNEVIMEIKKISDINARYKKLIFVDESTAGRFHHYVEFISETGKVVRAAFQLIDYRKMGKICREDLKKAMLRVDLIVADQDIEKM